MDLSHISCPDLLWRSKNTPDQGKSLSSAWLKVAVLLVWVFISLWVILSLFFMLFGSCTMHLLLTVHIRYSTVYCLVLLLICFGCFCLLVYGVFSWIFFGIFVLFLWLCFSTYRPVFCLCDFFLVGFFLWYMVVIWLYIQPHITGYHMRTHDARILYPDFMEE